MMFSSCSEDEPVASFPAEPIIELLTTAPTQVRAFQDSIVFTLRYQDGDGNLGSNDPDVRNLFITDPRINVVHEFRIQQLAPDNANIPIQGNLSITLPNTLITDASTQQTVSFSMYVVDNANNESNTVWTPNITVTE